MVAEILDGLAPDDPEAVRSRADLARINFLMGNERWIAARVGEHAAEAARGIVELGAGAGGLLGRLSEFGPATGLDLVPRPADLPEGARWLRMNVLEAELSGGVVVANLFLHHFEGAELERIGELIAGFRVLVAVEPWRSPAALALGRMVSPWVGRVTRHDMEASIRAGFVPGELGRLAALSGWHFDEWISPRGGLRILGRREGG